MTEIKPVFFPTPAKLRQWFEKHYKTETELLLGYYKVDTGKPSVSWSESVDEALCFGWIDGIRRSLNEESYCIRFTPRKPSSIWSAINIKKVEELKAKGLMKPEGLAVFEKRKAERSEVYSFENNAQHQLSPLFEKCFRANKKAWKWFEAMPEKSYRKVAIHWVMSAKQESTREKRMQTLIEDCAAGIKIKPLRY